MVPVIYKIKINNKSYIGSTTNFQKRKARHLRELKNNNHHNILMQEEYNKIDSEIEFFIIEKLDAKTSKNELYSIEEKYIRKEEKVLNIGESGGGDMITKHPNFEELKKKKSKHLKEYRNNLTKEERQKVYGNTGEENGNWKGGVTQNNCNDCGKEISPYAENCEEHKNLDHLEGETNPFYNKEHTEETIEKIIESNKGREPVNKKKIICEGKEFDSITQGAEFYGLTKGAIINRLKSDNFPDFNYK